MAGLAEGEGARFSLLFFTSSMVYTDPLSQSLSQDRRFPLWSYRELGQPMSGWSSLYGSYEVEVGK